MHTHTVLYIHTYITVRVRTDRRAYNVAVSLYASAHTYTHTHTRTAHAVRVRTGHWTYVRIPQQRGGAWDVFVFAGCCSTLYCHTKQKMCVKNCNWGGG